MLTSCKKEIFARNAHPRPVAVPAEDTSSQLLTFLYGLLPRTRGLAELNDSVRESDVVAIVERTSTGDESAAKEAEKKVVVTKKVKVTQGTGEGTEQRREMQAAVTHDQSNSENTDKRDEHERVEESHTVKKVLDNTERDGESAELVEAMDKKADMSEMEN